LKKRGRPKTITEKKAREKRLMGTRWVSGLW